jgi:pimeloyl-ACP methyl ester carboxylesterase
LGNRLQRIRVPTLILRGASDGFVSQEYAGAYAQRITGSRLDIIPAAGHEPQFEQSEEFLARIETFVSA